MFSRSLPVLMAGAIALTLVPTDQATAQDDGSWWYVSYFTVPFGEIDSLSTLWDFRAPLRAKGISDGKILDRKLLTHHTGNTENVMLMTEYSAWDAMDEGLGSMAAVYPDEVDRATANDFTRILYGGDRVHRDAIFREPAPTGPAVADPDEETQAYWYVTYSRRPWSRTDSLSSLWKHTTGVADEAMRNGSVLDQMNLIHHTAGIYNILNMAKYPSWAALERRSRGGAWRAALPDSVDRQRYGGGFRWVNEGTSGEHLDFVFVEH